MKNKKDWLQTLKKAFCFFLILLFFLLVSDFFDFNPLTRKYGLVLCSTAIFMLISLSLLFYAILVTMVSVVADGNEITIGNHKIPFDKFTAVYYDSGNSLCNFILFISSFFSMTYLESTTTLYFLKNDKIIDGVDLLGWGSSSIIEILEMLKKRNKSVYIDKNCPEEIILRKGFIQKHFDTHFGTDSYILSWFTFTILIFLIPLILIVMLLML